VKLVGQWFGGSSYARPEEGDYEKFTSLRHALVVFGSRLDDRRYPCVDAVGPDEGGPEMLLWKVKAAQGGCSDGQDDPGNSDYPDYRIFCGPRGGINYEAL
jgi:hypothetical protein